MSLPRIRKDFLSVLDIPSKKALLFKDFDGKEYWVPRSLCTLIKQKENHVIATLAAFKFEEITGIEPEDMATPFLSMGGQPLQQHRLQNIQLCESKTYPLKPAQRKQLSVAVQCRYNYLNWAAGAGKTLAALTLANSYLQYNIVDKIFVLCPASLQQQWQNFQLEYFPQMHITILSVEANSFSTSLPKMLAKFNAPLSTSGEGQGVRAHLIVDEIHMIKNLSALRTKRIDKYYKADCITGLTATSIGRNAGDLFYQYSLSDRAIIGSENYNSFAKHFLLFGGADGDKVVALQNTKQLSQRLSPYTFFLKKEEIRKDMPPKIYHKHYYDMETNQRQAYGAISGLISQVQARSKSGYIPKEKSYQITSFLQKISCGFIPDEEELQSIFGNLGLLGEAADNVAKIKTVSYQAQNKRIECIKQITATLNGQQAIIWCSFRDELEAVKQAYSCTSAPSERDWGEVVGGMSAKAIQKVIKQFQQQKFQYLIAMQQMGTGFDIPFISHAIYSTTVFDHIKRTQSEDRIHRINRTGDCHIYDVIAKNSIDERIQKVLQYKQEITSIFNGETISHSSR